ncbi:zinc-dependent metalloprotease [Tsukamurella tyrosinosolvens]|uniref:zinc-dependent metalloprotease n=1 Tax=Tsukamurella tyrosinosolvens TaxID=57704 RepID=UPI00079B2E73|nr:zinc-dependent metalloprotease [Tsukamurella tyrosinosolvens]AUN42793.1 hydrolase [Tsukamurella tyrosinosolvens]KXP02900.1 hydrolase [Tsukamurella tyrosinosolvens]KZL97308.1 hydrolase [Tsukamurella tyrosinosolvens]MCA4996368.1 zinc-dependent metalloprotease [Tsukamurella tyrosinosolvens]WEL93744.1 zinc-dependent metalloprotease [Tsukamurella tyrosinosolvens]
MDEPKTVRAQVDWAVAAASGRRVVRVLGDGPATTAYTRRRAAEELLADAAAAEEHVLRVTGLVTPGSVPPARTVDRREWVSAAARSMEALIEPENARHPGLGARLAGVQAGAMLGMVSGSVLGQYDPFGVDGGELLLVVPNVLAVERALRLHPDDFRMWVCLHEVTHRVQFAANPWLRDYMRENVAALAGVGGAGSVGDLLSRTRKALSGDGRHSGIIGVLEIAAPPEQFAAVERLLMLGTLLEGHADHVMDAAGPDVIPTVATIRAAFDRRRAAPSNPFQRLLRALMGMDAKIAQYVRGKKFVDAVVAEVGMERFNRVWTGPETLPLPDELDEPQRWIARVL